jgi:hypothetical protein
MSRYSAALRYSRGIPVQIWFDAHFLQKDARFNGREVPGIGPFNSTLLVMHNRIELNNQTSSLYDQGSPTPSARIYGFAEASESFMPIFEKDFSRAHRLRKVFALPLIYAVEDCDDLWVWISDLSVAFVKGRMGNNAHSCALASICYQLAESVANNLQVGSASDQNGASEEQKMIASMIETAVMKGELSKPDLLTGDAERHMLYDALEWISHSIRVLCDYSDEVKSVFQTLSMAYATPDTLQIQSLNACHLLNIKVSERMVGNWIYLSYLRYLRYSLSPTMKNFPIGLTALTVISPMIFHNTGVKGGWATIIGQIIGGLETALEEVNSKFGSGEIATDHDLRVATLEAFCNASQIINTDLVRRICEAVETGRSFESVIHSPRPAWMIDLTPMINGRQIENTVQITIESAEDSRLVRVIGYDSSNWSAICLRPDTRVRVKINSLGCQTRMGNTAGKGRIQNVRFSSTFDPHFADIMKGQKGVSTAGQVYYPGMDRFKPHIQPHKIDVDGEWEIENTIDGLKIECNGDTILKDNLPYFPEDYDGPDYTNSDRFALIAFKNCYLDLELVSYDMV